MKIKQAVERLIDHANGRTGLLVLPCEEGVGLAEFVLVRRADLELLLAAWGEKRQ